MAFIKRLVARLFTQLFANVDMDVYGHNEHGMRSWSVKRNK